MKSDKRPKVLILENDYELMEILDYEFTVAGYSVRFVHTPQQVLESLNREHHDVLVFDVDTEGDSASAELLRAVERLPKRRPFIVSTRAIWNQAGNLNLMPGMRKIATTTMKTAAILDNLSIGYSEEGFLSHERVDSNLNVIWTTPGARHLNQGHVENLSESGMFIAFPEDTLSEPRIHVADDIQFTLESPFDGGCPVVGHGKVRWVKNSPRKSRALGMGVMFNATKAANLETSHWAASLTGPLWGLIPYARS